MQYPKQHRVFEAFCEADRLFLADRHESGRFQMIPMTLIEPGLWKSEVELEPGAHRLRYYSGNERTVVYAGPALTEGSVACGWDAILRVPGARGNSASGKERLSRCAPWYLVNPA
jgi:hypothetical protein